MQHHPANTAYAMPPAARAPLPDAVLAILRRAHAHELSLARVYAAGPDAGFASLGTHYRQQAVERLAFADAVTDALVQAGMGDEAATLYLRCADLRAVLEAVPDDMVARMDLLDMQVAA